MNQHERRSTDTLRVVDGLVEAQLGQAVGGRSLARLAATTAIDYSGATWGSLFLDQGSGLEPVLTLRHDLERLDDRAEHDDDLLSEATASSGPVFREGSLAAPIRLQGRLRGLLYLDGLDPRRESEARDLGAAVAQRIGAFLSSADLVDRVAQQQKGLEILEQLGTFLTRSHLRPEHFDVATESARQGTASDVAIVVRLDTDGGVSMRSVAGEDKSELSKVADEIARSLARGERELPDAQFGEHHLCELFHSDEMTTAPTVSDQPPQGFVAVARVEGRPYDSTDGVFLRALAHLLGGALTREGYFQRASQDPVTETGSRLALQLSLAEAHNRARATDRPFSLVLADLDNFKAINDEHGHLIGDAVLREVADTLRGRLRTHDFVARYGGDEFVLVLPETTAEEAERLAEELRQLVAAHSFSPQQLAVSLSMGVAAFSSSVADDHELLRRADRALYDSKTAGRNRVSVYQ